MYDFCINGGGMVGATLALGLAQQNYQVAIIEPAMPAPYRHEDGPDLRVSAISDASVTLLKALGAWPFITAMRVKPYTGLSVWDDPNHRTDFTAESIEVHQLGFFVENRVLQLGCHEALASYKNVTRITSSKISHIALPLEQERDETKKVTVTLENDDVVEARWLIGADGAMSQVRQSAGVGTSGWQYAQQAMGITVKMDKPVPPVTWQQFTPHGPKAFLPMFNNFGSLVWYDSPERLKQLSALNNTQLAQQVIDNFPDELLKSDNGFTICGKATFPLTRAHASHYVTGRVVLIGDAAHTINPLAGQGVNLGFRDIEALLAVTSEGLTLSSTQFYANLKTRYEAPRRRDNGLMMSAMDAFYGLFSNDIGPIKWVRNQLLSIAQHVEPAKREVLKYAIGMREWKF
ncbi:FAD-dependent monooxygenase [Alteromonas sp. A079]|uniref:FAD-dependent monooxygenase n=1 Tax=Alteromonas sp. A079 TaxID=3410268 RepID=UPI003BA10744